MERKTHQTRWPFRGSVAVAVGEVTPARLRGPEFVPLFRDVYIGSSVEIDTRVRVAAVSLRAGPGAVVAGPLAALAWNAECPWDDAEAVLPGDRRLRREGITAREDSLAPDEVGERFGVAVTAPLRTAFDLARRGDDLGDAVAAVDSLGHRCGVTSTMLRQTLDRHPRVRGIVQARRVVELMDPLAESIPETHLRLIFVRRGMAPIPQHPVRRPDGKWYRLDLAWPDAMVAVEYDGDEHRRPERHADDLDRDAILDDLGWDVVRVTARQIYRFPDAVADRVARKLADRAPRLLIGRR